MATSLESSMLSEGRFLLESSTIRFPSDINELYEDRALNVIRVVLLGKTGEGKSSFGNSLLGNSENEYFATSCGGASETASCKYGIRLIKDRKLMVVDTPGLFDTVYDNEYIGHEIVKSIIMCAPGVHAFFIVIKAGSRFTKEAQDTISFLRNLFGDNVLRYCIIVFTAEDSFTYKGKHTFDTWLRKQPKPVLDLVEQCNNRCKSIDNHANSNELEKKVLEIVELVNTLIRDNNNTFYTHTMFKEAEKLVREREQAELKLIQEGNVELEMRIKLLQQKAEEFEADKERIAAELEVARAKTENTEAETRQLQAKLDALQNEKNKIQESQAQLDKDMQEWETQKKNEIDRIRAKIRNELQNEAIKSAQQTGSAQWLTTLKDNAFSLVVGALNLTTAIIQAISTRR